MLVTQFNPVKTLTEEEYRAFVHALNHFIVIYIMFLVTMLKSDKIAPSKWYGNRFLTPSSSHLANED